MTALFYCDVGNGVEGPLHCLKLASGFVDPSAEALVFAGTQWRPSANASLTDPCHKLLLAVFQLTAFTVDILGDPGAITCYGSCVMHAAAACPEGSCFVFWTAAISMLLISLGVTPWAKACGEISVQIFFVYCTCGKIFLVWVDSKFSAGGQKIKEALACPETAS